MQEIPAEECYQHLGFHPFEGGEQYVQAGWWRSIRESQNLKEMRERYLTMRDKAGWPVVDEGYVVGSVPAVNLSPQELEKLLSALTEAMTRGCTTVTQWQEFKKQQSSSTHPSH